MLRFVPEDTQCFVVMDLEWNQHASKPNHEIPHEIIEIGAVKLDRDLRILDEQQYIIKPVVYPVLDKHIREVTGIEPEELEDGLSFERAYHRFLKWCGPGAFLCTWGRDDYPVLLRNTRYYKLPLELAPPLNVQMVFSHLKTDKPLVQVGLSAAMEQLGMAMDLPAHRALNDAIYTAQVMARLQQDVDAAPPEAIDALKKFNAEEAVDLNIVLPESLKKELEPFVSGELANTLKGGVTAMFSKKVAGGFTIGPKDGSYFISLTDETFRALIGDYLRPATRKILFGE